MEKWVIYFGEFFFVLRYVNGVVSGKIFVMYNLWIFYGSWYVSEIEVYIIRF